MKLLAIPNDETKAYFRSYEEDFLSEFNPLDQNKKRIFEKVKFLNWKDKENLNYFGIESQPFLKNKEKASELIKELSKGTKKFESPMFQDIFLNEIEDIDEFIKNYNPDVIRSFNTFFAGELGSILKSKYKIPLVISAHDPSRLTSIVTEADSLICISENLKKECIEKFNVDKNKIKVIPDGIDMNFFYPRNKDIGYEAKYKILSVGRVVPSKNIETLLESLVYLKEELGENIKHLHLGNGTEENLKKINELKNNLGLEKITTFLGGKQKSELPFYYSWADVYSLPTLWEGLGRAQIESLACGTPVLTTNYAPMTEIIKDEYNGLTYNPIDPKDIAEKTIKYFTNNNLRRKMEKNSRISIEEKYNLNKIMQMHSENYREIIKK